jgi:N-terminal domain of anti-restriction factor ArdC
MTAREKFARKSPEKEHATQCKITPTNHRQSRSGPPYFEAVTKPGLIMKAYSVFHQYSVGNQILALVQCQMRGLQPGPINTFPKWKDLNRFVKRGERALSLCMPITCKRREEDSDEEHTFTSFVYKARWFVLAQTDGQELDPITIPEWDAERALTTLILSAFHSITRTEMCRALRASIRSQLTLLHNCQPRHFCTSSVT